MQRTNLTPFVLMRISITFWALEPHHSELHCWCVGRTYRLPICGKTNRNSMFSKMLAMWPNFTCYQCQIIININNKRWLKLKISNDNNTDKTDVTQSSLNCKQNSLNFKQNIAHIRMYYIPVLQTNFSHLIEITLLSI